MGMGVSRSRRVYRTGVGAVLDQGPIGGLPARLLAWARERQSDPEAPAMTELCLTVAGILTERADLPRRSRPV